MAAWMAHELSMRLCADDLDKIIGGFHDSGDAYSKHGLVLALDDERYKTRVVVGRMLEDIRGLADKEASLVNQVLSDRRRLVAIKGAVLSIFFLFLYAGYFKTLNNAVYAIGLNIGARFFFKRSNEKWITAPANLLKDFKQDYQTQLFQNPNRAI